MKKIKPDIWQLCLLLLLPLSACGKKPADKPGPDIPENEDEPGVATTLGVAKGTPKGAFMPGTSDFNTLPSITGRFAVRIL